jgi:hypothetical protein
MRVRCLRLKDRQELRKSKASGYETFVPSLKKNAARGLFFKIEMSNGDDGKILIRTQAGRPQKQTKTPVTGFLSTKAEQAPQSRHR